MIRSLLYHHHSWLPQLASAARTTSAALTLSPLTTKAPPSSMKAVTFDAPGGVEVLQLADVERPTPGQVRRSAPAWRHLCNNPRCINRSNPAAAAPTHARRARCWSRTNLSG